MRCVVSTGSVVHVLHDRSSVLGTPGILLGGSKDRSVVVPVYVVADEKIKDIMHHYIPVVSPGKEPDNNYSVN